METRAGQRQAVIEFFARAEPALLSYRSALSCRFIVYDVGEWELGVPPIRSVAALSLDDFLQLRKTGGIELAQFLREKRLRVEGREKHAIEVSAMLVGTTPLLSPRMAFQTCPGRFHPPSCAFMRATEQALLSRFTEYRVRLTHPRIVEAKAPFTDDPLLFQQWDPEPGGPAPYDHPFAPPFPFASYECAGFWWEQLPDLYALATGNSIEDDLERVDSYEALAQELFPRKLFGSDALMVHLVPKELTQGLSTLTDATIEAAARVKAVADSHRTGTMESRRKELDLIRSLARVAREENEELWLWEASE